MTLKKLLVALKRAPDAIDFNDVMDVIRDNYTYQETEFKNGLGHGVVINRAGTNEGSCKIFAFGQINNLSEPETLACFGDFYRSDVLLQPDGKDHQNIRNFIAYGWAGISFNGVALKRKHAKE